MRIRLGRIILIVFLFFTLLFRFYNLNWGAPFYFHPDERNVAYAVTKLQFPSQMNPQFFAYGSFPIYTIYFTGVLFNIFSSLYSNSLLENVYTLSFEQAIIFSRIYSAIFSSLTLFLLYGIAKKYLDQKSAVVTLLLGGFSVGFIQFAHFGTFEMWLSFFSLLLFSLSLRLAEKISYRQLIMTGSIFGLLCAIKISSVVLFILPLWAILLFFPVKKKSIRYQFFYLLKSGIIFGLTAILTYILMNPFVILDKNAFISSMQYESSVARGTLSVFYTGEFFNTTPMLYQLLHVYPFLLNPINTILAVCALGWILVIKIKSKKPFFILLTISFLLIFLSQAFLFVKWTRYMVPTLPFLYLMIAAFLTSQRLHTAYLSKLLIISSICISIVFSLSYWITTFVQEDTRIQSLEWAKNHIPSSTTITTEMYDLGIVPFNQYFPHISLYNFYDLDQSAPTNVNIPSSDYIILPSQRILKSRLINKTSYPNGYRFYSSLMNNSGIYEKIYQTPCDIWCRITFIGDPIFSFEQTASVFDRPNVFIFKKK